MFWCGIRESGSTHRNILIRFALKILGGSSPDSPSAGGGGVRLSILVFRNKTYFSKPPACRRCFGAGYENRTRVSTLGRSRHTTKLIPLIMKRLFFLLNSQTPPLLWPKNPVDLHRFPTDQFPAGPDQSPLSPAHRL